MRTNMNKISVAMLGIVLSVTTFALPSRADQPFMKAALSDLKQAQGFLKKAKADKGGHRVKAMELTANAITAVNQGIEWDRTHPGSSGNEDIADAPLPSDQPNMVAARDELKSALNNLNKATPNKGGYREQAIGFVQSAIDEVNAGIEYDRNH